MKKTLLLVIAAITSLAASAVTPALSRDSLERLCARMLIVGFKGDTVTADNPVVSYISDLGIGGIILFDVDLTGSRELGSRNITSVAQLSRLTADLKALATYPLFITADQEGGRVQRLKAAYGYEAIPSARLIGLAANPDTTRYWGDKIAAQLAGAGINLNLAPEVDIHHPDCPVIGKLNRSYSASPDSVALHAGITVDCLHRRGILGTLKHFPGHGSSTVDSHYGLPDVTSTWNNEELIPFKTLIDNGKADAIMTAHIINRNLDPVHPATLSRDIITGILRERLGFDGLVITDDLYMQGIIDKIPIDEALKLAINAGADMIVVGNNITTGFEADRPALLVTMIADAVEREEIEPARIIEANRRINAALGKFCAPGDDTGRN